MGREDFVPKAQPTRADHPAKPPDGLMVLAGRAGQARREVGRGVGGVFAVYFRPIFPTYEGAAIPDLKGVAFKGLDHGSIHWP